MSGENNYNKILQRQIRKSLPECYLQDANITAFLQLVSDHYKNIEVDKSLSEHAFSISEREYEQVLLEQKHTNLSLNNSIQQLKQGIIDLEPNYSPQLSQDSGNIDNVIDILKNISKDLKVKNEELYINKDELRKKYDELSKLNSDLDSFIYSTSHNLRSPLTSIKGITNILSDDELPLKERHFFLNLIKETTNALEGTIIDIIEYSRNAKTGVEYSLIDLENLATNSFNNNKYYSNYLIDFTVGFTDSKVNFYSDLTRVTSIFDNIISNAIKYNDKNKVDKKIKLTIQINEENAFIEVEDNGIGMSQKVLEKAFTMFYRGSNQASGTGLGLFMVKEMLEKIGGKIEVISAPGDGTKMLLTLKNFKK